MVSSVDVAFSGFATPPDDLLVSVARAAPRANSAAPSADEVDAVSALVAVVGVILAHNEQVFADKPVNWGALADRLSSAASMCRRLETGA